MVTHIWFRTNWFLFCSFSEMTVFYINKAEKGKHHEEGKRCQSYLAHESVPGDILIIYLAFHSYKYLIFKYVWSNSGWTPTSLSQHPSILQPHPHTNFSCTSFVHFTHLGMQAHRWSSPRPLILTIPTRSCQHCLLFSFYRGGHWGPERELGIDFSQACIYAHNQSMLCTRQL